MDGNGLSDMFVRDLSAGVTTRVSVDTGGGDANGPSDQGNGRPGISADGNLVVFAPSRAISRPVTATAPVRTCSYATSQNSTTTLVSAASSGGSGASISDDGRFVAFQTTQIWVHDRADRNHRAGERAVRPAGERDQRQRVGQRRRPLRRLPQHRRQPGDRRRQRHLRHLRAIGVDADRRFGQSGPGAGGTFEKLTVTGSGFLPGAKASASLFTPPGVTVTSVKVKSETKLEVTVTVDDNASLGPRNLFVWNPGTGPGAGSTTFALCHDCFAVASGTHR